MTSIAENIHGIRIMRTIRANPKMIFRIMVMEPSQMERPGLCGKKGARLIIVGGRMHSPILIG
jgi:hypothetical protein